MREIVTFKGRHASCNNASMEIKRLLLELDPHKDNDSALQRARTVAASFGADVEVLVCAPPRVVPATAPTEPGIIAVAQHDSVNDFEEWATKQVAPLVEAGINVPVSVTTEQPRYEAILTHANECGADLIMRVVGGQSRLKRLFLGATDWDLIRHSKRPLWLVQPDAAGTSPNVLAAVDPMHEKDEKMNLDRRLLDFGRSLARANSGSLHVYHAIRPTPAIPPEPSGALLTPPDPQPDPKLMEKVNAAHKTRLDELLEGYDIPEDRVHMLVGEPTNEINGLVEQQRVGVVVAGAISRSWLDRLIVGSTAEALLDTVSCDLVLLTADA